MTAMPGEAELAAETAAAATAAAFVEALTHGDTDAAVAMMAAEKPLAVVVTPKGEICRGGTPKQVQYVLSTLTAGLKDAQETAVTKSVTHGLVSLAVWHSKGDQYSLEAASTTVACAADGKSVKSVFTTLHGSTLSEFQIEHPLPGCEDEVPPVPEAEEDGDDENEDENADGE